MGIENPDRVRQSLRPPTFFVDFSILILFIRRLPEFEFRLEASWTLVHMGNALLAYSSVSSFTPLVAADGLLASYSFDTVTLSTNTPRPFAKAGF